MALGLLLLGAYLWTQLPVQQWIEQFRLWILSLGAAGVGAFVLVYVLITLVVGPATALSMTAGLAYGAWGFPLVVGSATLGAAVAFLIGRYLAREPVTHWINRDRRLQALNKAISDEGWRVVGLMRLSPIIPYGVQNYFFSITSVGFLPYVFATLVGIMPATALFVYIGALGQSLGRSSALQWVLLAAGLGATVLLGVFVGRRARAVLADHALNTDR